MKEQIKNLVENFGNLKVVVIGDAILDVYLKGKSDRLSREAPVPIINVHGKEFVCGGAANAAINLAALGAQTIFLSVIGKDSSGRELLEVLKKNKVNTECVIKDKNRVTLSKKRIVASNNIMIRLDEGNTDEIRTDCQKVLIDKLKKLYKLVDAVVLSDYGYGVITEEIKSALKKLKDKDPKVLIIDSKDLKKFKDLSPTAVKPNYEESVNLLKLQKLSDGERVNQIMDCSKKYFELTGAACIAATLDMDGSVIFEKGKKPYHIQGIPQDNKNSIGAGDTFISALTLSLSSGAPVAVATEIATAASSVVLQKEGTVVCTSNDLKAYFNENPKYYVNLNELVKKIELLKKQGKKIVFSNGCFDILHKGHVSLLNQARALGDVLIVGINSDSSIKRLKGPERPINCLDDRITVLAGLQSVDFLISFEEESPVKIIKAIKPNVLVKGGDYSESEIPEAGLIRQLGGEVKIINFIQDKSTSNIIKKIRDRGAVKELNLSESGMRMPIKKKGRKELIINK